MAGEYIPTDPLSIFISSIAAEIGSSAAIFIDRRSLSELSSCLNLALPIIYELYDNEHSDSIFTFYQAIQELSESVSAAVTSSIALKCSGRSRIYLLLRSRQVSCRLASVSRDISLALSYFPLTLSAIRDRLNAIEFSCFSTVEEVLNMVEAAVCDRSSDRGYASRLLSLAAEIAGVSNDSATLRTELDELRAEVGRGLGKKVLTENVQMDKIVSFFSLSDSISSFLEREERYFSKRHRLGNHLLDPLQPFLCPITGDVMVDPVETSVGHTFEKCAIEKWFVEGNCTCPLTMTAMSVVDLRPNYTLKKSIEEWKERNSIIAIANLKTNFKTDDEQEVLHCFNRLEQFCKEIAHREWIIFENYLPVIVEQLYRKNSEIRCRALFVFYILAQGSDDIKGRFAGVDNLIEFVVMSLGRRCEERKLAVALLLELSKNEIICDKIGKARGCIFLLITITNDGNQSASDATLLLENLSFIDENVAKMAKMNYFKSLLQRLKSGDDYVKKTLATTLCEIELTDQSKAILFKDGALDILLPLCNHNDTNIKAMVVKSLLNLSSVPENGVEMIRGRALSTFFDLLRGNYSIVSHVLSEHAAATIMNMASSAATLKDAESLDLLKSEDMLWFFSMLDSTSQSIQLSVLQSFYALCRVTSSEDIRYKLKQCHAIESLIPLCRSSIILLRLYTVKLLSCLTEDIEASYLANIADTQCVETLLSIINTSKNEEEIAASMAIISNLPSHHTQIIKWLLDENGLDSIVQILKSASLVNPSKNSLIENAIRVLHRVATPENFKCQKMAVQAGVISHIVPLLEFGPSSSKRYAAILLAQFSEISFKLSRPAAKRRGFFCCAEEPEEVCPVHAGVCSVEHSFCLLKAGAVLPLIRLLTEEETVVNNAALIALSTLIVKERLQSGSKLLFEMNAIVPIIKLLNSQSVKVQEKAAIVLEMVFRLQEYRKIFGDIAQMPLIDLAQKGDAKVRVLAAKILAHLDVLHEQSSYF